jgi:hypothetical protein
MITIFLLLLCPLLIALAVFSVRSQKRLRGSCVPAALVLILSGRQPPALPYNRGVRTFRIRWLKYAVTLAELGMAAYIVRVGEKNRAGTVIGLAVIRLLSAAAGVRPPITPCDEERFYRQSSPPDVLISGIIGSLICVFAVEYIKDTTATMRISRTAGRFSPCCSCFSAMFAS